VGAIAKGVWTIALVDRGGGGSAPRPFDAELTKQNGAKFASNILAESVLNIPATANEVISVASHVTRVSSTGTTGPAAPTIAATSSRGPTPDGRKAPTIAAPGEYIVSARPLAPTQQPYVPKAGTSMAAPHVAGVIALMLEAKPTLLNSEIADILRNTAVKPAVAFDEKEWGRGMLDALAAVKKVE
jgi:subtilisin family serine protease